MVHPELCQVQVVEKMLDNGTHLFVTYFFNNIPGLLFWNISDKKINHAMSIG